MTPDPLLTALAADPDPSRLQVYADWLEERGDACGALGMRLAGELRLDPTRSSYGKKWVDHKQSLWASAYSGLLRGWLIPEVIYDRLCGGFDNLNPWRKYKTPIAAWLDYLTACRTVGAKELEGLMGTLTKEKV